MQGGLFGRSHQTVRLLIRRRLRGVLACSRVHRPSTLTFLFLLGAGFVLQHQPSFRSALGKATSA